MRRGGNESQFCSMRFVAPLLAFLRSDVPAAATTIVYGTVAFNGKPVPMGLVVIEPDAAKATWERRPRPSSRTAASARCQVTGPLAARCCTVNADGVPQPLWPRGKLLSRTYQFHTDLPERWSSLDIQVPAEQGLPPADAEEPS